jgi:DNA repair protein RadC
MEFNKMTISTDLNYYPISKSVLIENGEDMYMLSEPLSKKDIYYLMLDLLEEEYFRPDQLTSPAMTRKYLQLKLGSCEREVFSCVFLDSQHRVIKYEELFQGTIDSCSVTPRELVKRCLQLNCAAIILAHPHPSGDPTPSQADIRITERLKEALQLIDVRIIDHLIFGGADSVSLAERELL